MTRRPVCLACLLLMAAIVLADWMGFPLIRGNPLPDSVREWISRHPEAVVCGETVRCARTEFSQSVYLKNAYLIYKSEKVSIENVRVFLKEDSEVPVGTLLLVSGTLERVGAPRNPGEFDSRQYYAAERIYYFMKDGKIEKRSRAYSGWGQFLAEIRQKGADILEATAGEEAPVFAAMALGEKSNLEEETKIRYQMAGIIHILAISGLHISLLGMGLYKLLKKACLGIWPSGMISLIIMLGYGIMTGGSVSTMRAVCMFLLSVGAQLLGRCYDMHTALALSAVLVLLDSPACLYNSSFLLSFGAVVGLGAVAPVLLKASGTNNKTVQTFLSSFAVQLFTLPVLLWFYGEVSLAGILLNLLVLPTVGVVLACGAAGILAGLVCLPLAWFIVLPGRILLIVYEKLCALAGRLPLCTWIGGVPKVWQIVIYYGLLGAALFGLWKLEKKKEEKKQRGKILIKAVCLFAMAAGAGILGWHPLDSLKITCLDVGQGDGIVVETPEGYCFLVDGGSSNKSDVGQYQILPYLKSQGISQIDGIFISHTDDDHISGVRQILEYSREGLTTVRVKRLFLPKWKERPGAHKDLETLALSAGAEVFHVDRGDLFRGGRAELSVLAPLGDGEEDSNENGMVLLLRYGKFKGLFTGDIGEEREKKLLPYIGIVDFLKVGHHGSRYSTSEVFLEKLRPKIGVISCSDSNTYGHPSPETIERLENAGCQVEYTMKNGAITIKVKEKMIFIERFVKE